MQTKNVECKVTSWFVRRAVFVMSLLLGFGGYFFYDGTVGYLRANEVYFSHQAFSCAGQEAASLNALTWQDYLKTNPMWKTEMSGKTPCTVDEEGRLCPLPTNASPVWPEEMTDRDKVCEDNGWYNAWVQYSARRKFPVNPVERAYDVGAVLEQNVAGWICVALATGCLFLLLRTLGRKLSYKDGVLTVAGQILRAEEIVKIDIRSWKLKGLAWLYVKCANGKIKKLRVDGLTYGGFDKESSESAERWLQCVLSQFDGDVVRYDEGGERKQ